MVRGLDMSRKQIPEVEEYEFSLFQETTMKPGEIGEFQFNDIETLTPESIETHKKVISLERKQAEKTNFSISPIVREHRGFIDQEDEEREKRIQDEVRKRIEKIKDDAFQSGYEEGLESGQKEVFNQLKAATEEKVALVSDMVEETIRCKQDLLAEEKIQTYKIVKNLVKWITLKEIKEDDNYVIRLLEKLITELQTKSNLLIMVNQAKFEKMPEILKIVEDKLGTLQNVRVETDYDIKGPGLIVESENGILNGTLTEQFRSLDKLFESEGVDSEKVDFIPKSKEDSLSENVVDEDDEEVLEAAAEEVSEEIEAAAEETTEEIVEEIKEEDNEEEDGE